MSRNIIVDDLDQTNALSQEKQRTTATHKTSDYYGGGKKKEKIDEGSSSSKEIQILVNKMKSELEISL